MRFATSMVWWEFLLSLTLTWLVLWLGTKINDWLNRRSAKKWHDKVFGDKPFMKITRHDG